MKTAQGILTLTQEHRFQLDDDEGNRKLFILRHDAPLQARDLERLVAAGTRVAVSYTDADGLAGYTAHDVEELSAFSSARQQ